MTATPILKEIKGASLEEISETLASAGEAKFRSKQVFEWIWKKNVLSFDQMTNISQNARNILASKYCFQTPVIAIQRESKDKTIKVAFKLFDDTFVEGVIIPSKDRATACISSQVGCALECTFCATGTLGLNRNLSAGEMYDQVYILNKLSTEKFGYGLSNIVLMGMGEPLMNYENVMKAIDFITTSKGMGMSPQRITLSTAGLSSKIKQLADDDFKCNLAISLHSAFDSKRTNLMKINKSNPLDELQSAIQYFAKKTGERVTLEYLLLDSVNDSLEDAAQLAKFCKAFPCKINIIEYNVTNNSPFNKSPRVSQFASFLESKNMIVNVRASKGQDIDAACGQLVNSTK